MEPRSMNPGESANTGTSTTGAVGAMAGRAHSAIDSTVEKVAPTVNRMVDKAHEAVNRVADRAAPAAENIETAVRGASDQTVRFAEACASSIRARPLAAVGAAFAIGYVLGRFRS
jgi:ElaB/YqjD/DUF883 family membrane-anchored ribosome-binding protein